MDQANLGHPNVGCRVWDSAARRVGVVMGAAGPYVMLRPPGGGIEWQARSENLREDAGAGNPEAVRDTLRGELQLLGAEPHDTRLTRLTSGRVVVSVEVPLPVARQMADKLSSATFTPLPGMALYSQHTESVGEMVGWDGPQAVILRSLATGEENTYWLNALRPALLSEVRR